MVLSSQFDTSIRRPAVGGRRSPLRFLTLAALAALVAGCGRGRPTPVAVTPIPTIDPTTRHLRVFDAAWSAVNEQYVRDDFNGVDWKALGDEYRGRVASGVADAEFSELMNAMLANLPDRQALFETRAERLEQETADLLTYHGIGAFIAFRDAPEPHVVILAVIEDSPAEKAGLRAHDSVYAVDGQPFSPDDAGAPAQRIRGPADSRVVLTVQSPGAARRDVTLDREQIVATDMLRGAFLDSVGVAYYRVPVAADRSLAQIIAQNLAGAAQSGEVNGVILDLRVARSGNASWPLEDMLTLFADGEVGEFFARTGTDPLAVQGLDVLGSQSVPLVILIGPDTEGSPEIFAAALQGTGRAVLMGLPTPGAVEGLTEVPLPDGSRIFLATSSFRTSKNVDLAEHGLTPDVRIDVDWDAIAVESDPAVEAAIALLISE